MSDETTTTETTIIDRIIEAAAKVRDDFTGALTDDRDYTLFHASTQMVQAVNDYHKATEVINHRSIGWKYDWSSIADMMQAEAKLRFWHEVVAISSPSQEDVIITTGGLTTVLQRRVSQMLRNSGGQSTSQISNAQDHQERELTSRLVSHFGSLVGIKNELI
jgi:hypothetical protein